MTISSHKDLIVWQKAKRVAILVYSLTDKFPHEEKYGLTSQIRRSAVSVVANIAEGRGRNTRKDFVNFLHFSLGSCTELETELIISKELSFGTLGEYTEIEGLLIEVQKMLNVMIKKLKAIS
ncbi:MAG: four helix bundle protein [Candidatus Pacebacteria bacterium]|nr:four helix bundle protein [Candidatus Paceibacterota bacterium]